MLRVASLVAVFAASGCYAPDLLDCTVTCSGPDECAGDQVCNSAGFCAAEGATCPSATVDAPGAMITLRVQVDGTGKVVLAGVGECDDSECTWQVPMGTLRFDAQRIETDKPFERWTTPNCGGAQTLLPTCTFTPTASTTVGAKFK
jgi:hypothetical protein